MLFSRPDERVGVAVFLYDRVGAEGGEGVCAGRWRRSRAPPPPWGVEKVLCRL